MITLLENNPVSMMTKSYIGFFMGVSSWLVLAGCYSPAKNLTTKANQDQVATLDPPSNELLAKAYREGVITLSPPLRRYGDLKIKWDRDLLARSDFKGIREIGRASCRERVFRAV